MNKVYIVLTETREDEEVESQILDNQFFTERDAAREAMIRDFNAEKGNFDACDDTDEDHRLDSCTLSANMKWTKQWWVLELAAGK